jgi:hypothetical protein
MPLPPGFTAAPDQDTETKKPEADFRDAGADIKEIEDEPGIGGALTRGAVGFGQGFALDIPEAAGGWLGRLVGAGDPQTYLPEQTQQALQGIRDISNKSTSGTVGRVAGQLANPLTRAIPEIQALARATRYAPQAVRAGERLAQNIGRGIVGSQMVPTDDPTVKFKEWLHEQLVKGGVGGAIGGILGLPGTLARAWSLPSSRPVTNALVTEAPGGIGNWIAQMRNAPGNAGFDTVWMRYSLEPLGAQAARTAPREAGFDSMREVSQTIGNAINQATARMQWQSTPTSVQNLMQRAAQARTNLRNPDVIRDFDDIIQHNWNNAFAGGPGYVPLQHLSSAELQNATNNLQAAIDRIDPNTSAENRGLIRELENFKMAIYDNATMSPQERLAYRNARDAWSRFATLRDAATPGSPTGIVGPDAVARELQRREPFRYPEGQARAQAIANEAQQTLLRQKTAATRAAQGLQRPPQGRFAQPAGVLSSDVLKWLNTPPDQSGPMQ